MGHCIHSYSKSDEQELEWFCKQHYTYTSPPFTINIPSENIPNSQADELLLCSGTSSRDRNPFHDIKSNYFVASDRWGRLPFHSGEKINLLSSNSLSRLVPSKGIHLVTFQNGIQNTVEEFANRGRAIWSQVKDHFREAPLCIGFYNPSSGDLFIDSMRALRRYMHKYCGYIKRTAIFFESLLGLMTSFNPRFRWLHVAHSEGGAIAHLALHMVLLRQEKYNINKHPITNHLITATYGPVLPVPRAFALQTYNTYSNGDNATWRYMGKNYYGHEAYEINLVDSLNPPRTSRPPGDHDFLGDTYQHALSDNLDDIITSLAKGVL